MSASPNEHCPRRGCFAVLMLRVIVLLRCSGCHCSLPCVVMLVECRFISAHVMLGVGVPSAGRLIPNRALGSCFDLCLRKEIPFVEQCSPCSLRLLSRTVSALMIVGSAITSEVRGISF